MFLHRKFSPGLSRAINHLLRSLPGIRHATGTAADPDTATATEKLDAALNNMSHGLCMFGPDNRPLLWNDRYVKMYKLAPDRLRVGCTLDEMLEARKAAGTAYRDLGQYGSKLQTAMTTRSPDNLVAQLDDGRIVNVSCHPTQNGCWVSTHEDIIERAPAILRRIKGLGVRIAMDDFGTGYSSLSYLQDFPFDKIKIDQTFISRIGDSFQAGAIIYAILRLGRTLAMPVIAEGVETEEQRGFLAREGCQVQGYLIGRPEPIAHYRHLVAGLAGMHENVVGVR
jgi:hypothetical protein